MPKQASIQYWFKAKNYGWGWYPATWQGWLSGLVFVLAIVGGSVALLSDEPDTYGPVFIYVAWVIVCTIILGLISYKKGEKPGWRWGKKA